MAQAMNNVRRNGFNRRVSWGAVFAGVVIVLVTQLMLSLLWVAFGAGSIDLMEKNPISGLGLGSGIFLVVSTLLSLFAGGWVAARLAAMPDRTDAALHGAVTWGLASLAMVYLVTSAAGSVVSGAAGVLGTTATIAGQGAQVVAPEIAKAVGAQFGDDGVSWSEVKQEAKTLLRQTKKKALQPNEVSKMAGKAGSDAKAAASDIAEAPQSAGDELASLWEAIEARGEKLINAADQEALANVLVARTDLSKQEAMATVARWQKTLNEAQSKLAEMRAGAEKKLREVANSAASTVSSAATWSFIGLLLGLVAAVGGGYLGGTPLDERVTFVRHRQMHSEEPAA